MGYMTQGNSGRAGRDVSTTHLHPLARHVTPGRAAPSGRRWLSALAAGLLGSACLGQTDPTYAGRPFVVVARNNANDPVAGFISGFGRAQVVDQAVVLVTLNGLQASGVFRGRGGALEKVAAAGTGAPPGPLQSFHFGFARDDAPGTQIAFAAGTGPGRADGLFQTDGANVTELLPPGSVLPNSGGLPVNFLGEPFLAQGALAGIAGHAAAGGGADLFRGVYRVEARALLAVADTATALPDGFGMPDTFSSQVGFDGQTLAFWASRGPLGENQGMFVQPAPDQPVRRIARDGTPFPDGGTMVRFISPPVVAGGAVYFFAYDAANQARLLRYASGVLTTLVRDGDVTAEGGQLQSLGQAGLGVDGDRVFFPAWVGGSPGLYLLEEGVLKTLIAPGTLVGGLRPAGLLLQDVSGDTIVLEVADTSGNRRLVANLAAPAPPVIVSRPPDQTVAAGARVEWTVSVLGDAPLAYRWSYSSPTGLVVRSTEERLVLEAAGAVDVGYYSLEVTNFHGRASASFQLNVEVAPVIVNDLQSVTVETGDQLTLRVTALGGFPLGYTWLKDDAPVTNETQVAGLFSRKAASPADAGRYRVLVTNAWGQVSSAEAVVAVLPSPPNPVVAGRRLETVLDAGTPLPGTEGQADPADGRARIWGERLVWAGRSTTGQPLGLWVWEAGAWSRILAPNIELPNGLGAAEGLSLLNVRSLPGDPLVFTALKAGLPVGIYRLDGGTLRVVADTTLAAPDEGGARFANFFGDVVTAGDRVLFIANVAGRWGLYLEDESGLRRVLSTSQDLPVVGTASIQFTGLGFDGARFLVSAATAAPQKAVLLRGDLAGGISGLLARGDPVPDTAQTVNSLGVSAAGDGALFTQLTDNLVRQHIIAWQAEGGRRVVGAGSELGALGTIQNLMGSSLPLAGGQVWVAVRLTTPTGMQPGVVAASAAGLEPVFFTAKLDGRRVNNYEVLGAAEGRLLLRVFFEDGARALYANVGPSAEAPLRLEFTRAGVSTLRLQVPAGAILEAAEFLGGTWQVLEGTGNVDVPLTGGGRFFRLRRP